MRRNVKVVCDAGYGIGNHDVPQELFFLACGAKKRLFELLSEATM
jgi:hypothetical protein